MGFIKCVHCNAKINYDARFCSNCGKEVSDSKEAIHEFIVENGKLIKYGGKSAIVIIPEGVVEIGEKAFEYSKGIKQIKIPSTVIKIPECTFLSCKALTKIEVDENNEKFSALDGNLYNKDKTVFLHYSKGTRKKEFVIPEGVIKIGDYAFQCADLNVVVFPNGLKEIGRWAFMHCSHLVSVKLNDELAIIKENAFYGCCYILEITVPGTVCEIGKGAFNFLSSSYIENWENIKRKKDSWGAMIYAKHKEDFSRRVIKGVAGSIVEETAKQYCFRFEKLK